MASSDHQAIQTPPSKEGTQADHLRAAAYIAYATANGLEKIHRDIGIRGAHSGEGESIQRRLENRLVRRADCAYWRIMDRAGQLEEHTDEG